MMMTGLFEGTINTTTLQKQCHIVYHFHIPLQTHYQNYKPSSKC